MIREGDVRRRRVLDLGKIVEHEGPQPIGRVARWICDACDAIAEAHTRHPTRLIGLATLLWAGAHLAVNSEARSLVLFGGIGLWALVSIVWISVRDWQRHPRPAANWYGTGLSVGAGLALTALLIFWGHGMLTGIPLY